jgi:hypothetical protein
MYKPSEGECKGIHKGCQSLPPGTVPTALSRRLSDRCDTRPLLAWHYGLRGFSRLFLPYAEGLTTQALFGVVYGLDWVATVPPTAGLASDLFGQRSGPILFGWIFFGHQGGAAVAMVVP